LFPKRVWVNGGKLCALFSGKSDLGPKAIIDQTADPVVVGAIIAEIPMIDQVDTQQIETGNHVEVDRKKGIMKIWKKGK